MKKILMTMFLLSVHGQSFSMGGIMRAVKEKVHDHFERREREKERATSEKDVKEIVPLLEPYGYTQDSIDGLICFKKTDACTIVKSVMSIGIGYTVLLKNVRPQHHLSIEAHRWLSDGVLSEPRVYR